MKDKIAKLEARIAELEGRIKQLEAQAAAPHASCNHYHYYPPVYWPPPVSIPSVWEPNPSPLPPYVITTAPAQEWITGDPITPTVWMTGGNSKESN